MSHTTLIILMLSSTLLNLSIQTNSFSSDLDLSTFTSTQGFQIKNTPSNSANAGQSMCYADVNNDGIKDLVIGNSMASPSGRTNAGVVNVIFGTSSSFGSFDLSSITSAQGFKIIGATAGDNVGDVVLCPGDLNGDLVGDIVLGAPAKSSSAGIVYVIFGRTSGNSDIDLASLTTTKGITFTGTAAGAKLGASLGTADVNSDSRKDLIFSAPIASSTLGSVWVIYGTAIGSSNINLASLAASVGYRINGPTAAFKIGTSLSYAGDFNHDGKDDFIIGASSASVTSRTGSGLAYVIYGGGPTTINLASLTTQGFVIQGANAGDGLGNSVSYAGDINGDGIGDVIIGSSTASPSSLTGAGCSYVIYGKVGGYSSALDLNILTTSQGFVIFGANVGDGFGSAVTNAGDINGDGIADVLIAAPGFDSSLSRLNAGAFYVILGKIGTFSNLYAATLTLPQGFKIMGVAASDKLGQSVNFIGDANQDGYNDMLVRAPLSTNAGAVYVVYGGPLSYEYWDGTYLPSCSFPLVTTQISGTGVIKCDYPCTSLVDSLYWNGTCSSCDLPFSTRTYKSKPFCDYPCTNGDYLYWDGTCSSCNSPLSPQLSDGLLFCIYPCTNPVDYLYWDGTCSSSCDSPLSPTIYKDEFFCDFPCANPSDFLYWNGSCIPSYCPAPMIIQTVSGNQICSKPCTDDDLYYYVEDQTCQLGCPSPYHQLDEEYGNACSLFASTQDIEEVQNLVQTMNVINTISGNSLFALNLVFPGLSAAATSASLARLIAYTRYLYITASPRLKILYSNFDTHYGIPYVPGLPSKVRDSYHYRPVLPAFERYNISASFLVNYWGAFMTIAICLAVFLILQGLHYISPKKNPPKLFWRAISHFKIIAQNFIFIEYYETIGDLFLYAFLESHTQIFGSVGFNASLAFSIFCLIAGIAVLVFHFVLLRRYQKVTKSAEDSKRAECIKEFKHRYAGFQILLDDFKDTTFFSQAFLPFFMIRIALFQIILVVLQSSPFTQVLLITLPGVVSIVYLVRKLPYKHTLELIQAIVLELILLIVNTSLLEVEALDMGSVQFNNIQDYLGEVIIYCSLLCHCVPALFVIVKIISLIKIHWRSVKTLLIKTLVDIGLNIPISDQEEHQITSQKEIQETKTTNEIYTVVKEITVVKKVVSAMKKIEHKDNEKEKKKTRTIKDIFTSALKKITVINKITAVKDVKVFPSTCQDVDSPEKVFLNIESPQTSATNSPGSRKIYWDKDSKTELKPRPPRINIPNKTIPPGIQKRFKFRSEIDHISLTNSKDITIGNQTDNQVRKLDQSEVVRPNILPLNTFSNSLVSPSISSVERISEERKEKEENIASGSTKILSEVFAHKKTYFVQNRKRINRPLGKPNRK